MHFAKSALVRQGVPRYLCGLNPPRVFRHPPAPDNPKGRTKILYKSTRLPSPLPLLLPRLDSLTLCRRMTTRKLEHYSTEKTGNFAQFLLLAPGGATGTLFSPHTEERHKACNDRLAEATKPLLFASFTMSVIRSILYTNILLIRT